MNRRIHVLATLPFTSEEGLRPLLSRDTLNILQGLQRSYLHRVNKTVQGTDLAAFNLYQLVERTHRDSSQALLHHYSSQAWNMDFWLQGLTSHHRPPLPALVQAIERDFGSWESFETMFSESAGAIPASGWTWLVQRQNGRLTIMNTYNAGSPMFVNMRAPVQANPKREEGGSFSALLGMTKPPVQEEQTADVVAPILALNMWEHAWIRDYGLDRDAYIRNFWKCVNWSRAAVILNLY
ncbi:superoxide dismutase [Paramicrosporidium saccamoebae]|uniref:Superoxide dismutase n=1 Tax=Paramicrosporidium saccamoebae TaxID=1246581 RepID=A0A2H9TFM9_9FUNG|nr:superoxide dismutase [Paramicrosporidium saccamoebae]